MDSRTWRSHWQRKVPRLRVRGAAALDIFAPVLPINEAIMRKTPNLVAKYQQLSARDLVHVATCDAAGIDLIVSPNRGLDQVEELRRIDPKDVAVRLL